MDKKMETLLFKVQGLGLTSSREWRQPSPSVLALIDTDVNSWHLVFFVSRADKQLLARNAKAINHVHAPLPPCWGIENTSYRDRAKERPI